MSNHVFCEHEYTVQVMIWPNGRRYGCRTSLQWRIRACRGRYCTVAYKARYEHLKWVRNCRGTCKPAEEHPSLSVQSKAQASQESRERGGGRSELAEGKNDAVEVSSELVEGKNGSAENKSESRKSELHKKTRSGVKYALWWLCKTQNDASSDKVEEQRTFEPRGRKVTHLSERQARRALVL